MERYDNEVPVFLSGGLELDSLEEIKNLGDLNIHALDINSKFEVEAGLKEIKKVKSFIDKVRNELYS